MLKHSSFLPSSFSLLKRYYHPYRLGNVLEAKLKNPRLQVTYKFSELILHDSKGRPLWKKPWFLASSFFVIYHICSHPFLVTGAIAAGFLCGKSFLKRSLIQYRLNSDMKAFLDQMVLRNGLAKLPNAEKTPETEQICKMVSLLRSSLVGGKDLVKDYHFKIQDYQVLSEKVITTRTYLTTPAGDLYNLAGAEQSQEAQMIVVLKPKSDDKGNSLTFDCTIHHPHMILRLMKMSYRSLLSLPIITSLRISTEANDNRKVRCKVPPEIVDRLIRDSLKPKKPNDDIANDGGIPDADFQERK